MLLDTSAWIELFIESPKGSGVKSMVENKESYFSIVSVPEIVVWSFRNNKNPYFFLDRMKKASDIISINEAISILAGELNYKMKKSVKDFGMIDSIILATSRIYDLKIVTTDPHFKDLDNVIML